ncbi:hypothetical protein [Paenibacillus mendelii]|uniref:Excinuclease ABC subunit A n=1 Tax=Paenibacillus mendelii TaxID=206163 RepID=A0ABV6JIL0_9BACL|nr:hypothetical protein [Paenibacillus mendelii]MCQ6557265.1 hypothetical protein [Paenibacillus mendelii]
MYRRYSFNSKGACDNCQGAGVIFYINLALLNDANLPWDVCEGKRFKEVVQAAEHIGSLD